MRVWAFDLLWIKLFGVLSDEKESRDHLSDQSISGLGPQVPHQRKCLPIEVNARRLEPQTRRLTLREAYSSSGGAATSERETQKSASSATVPLVQQPHFQSGHPLMTPIQFVLVRPLVIGLSLSTLQITTAFKHNQPLAWV